MQKVIIDVPTLSNQQNIVNGSLASALITKAYKNGIFIPKNATNGEIIQALFPNIDKGFANVIDLNLWWKAPCKAETKYKWEQTDNEDCISRESVFQIFDDACYIDSDWYATREKIEKLPSVTPTRPKGKWIATENEDMDIVGYYCSCCDLPMETEEKTNYCPNCGADMRESDKE